jgi:hypothetical protein
MAEVRCQACNEQLTPSSDGAKEPCPKCGSTLRAYRLKCEPGAYGTYLGMVCLEHQRPDEKRPAREVLVGDDVQRSTGEWMEKARVIDRDADHYFERVVDARTGKVVHECDEELSKHRGHGSAKKPPPS